MRTYRGAAGQKCPGAEKIPVNLIRVIPAEEKGMNVTCSCCLAIAGSDSGGNAGIQADLRTFHAYGLHGCTVFAALTAQNPFSVSAIQSVPADFIAAQLDAVLGVYGIAALKTGMPTSLLPTFRRRRSFRACRSRPPATSGKRRAV